MSSFTKVLMVSPLADGKTWVTLRAFSYYTKLFPEPYIIEVSSGFTTDFTSVPRVLWVFFPRWGKYGNAAVIHDWLYWKQTFNRLESDHILLEGMEVLGTGTISRYTIYYCVRMFGLIAWRRNQYDKRAGFIRVLNLKEDEIKSTQVSQRAGVVKRIWWGMIQ